MSRCRYQIFGNAGSFQCENKASMFMIATTNPRAMEFCAKHGQWYQWDSFNTKEERDLELLRRQL